jgi:hypothetical protein
MTDGKSGEESLHPLGLYALAAHAAGDFPLQTDDMAVRKFDNSFVRAKHVTVYTAAFLPVVRATEWTLRQQAMFLAGVWTSHYVIDSRRWNDTVPIWYDQALHLIALAAVFALTTVIERD